MDTVLDALARIQNVLNVDEDNLKLLTELTQIQTEMLMEKLGGIEVPENLIYIIVETTIARYRRVGAEGISDKRVDVITNKYTEDLFAPYDDIISHYSVKPDPNTKFVRLI